MPEPEHCKDLLSHLSEFVDGEASESLCEDIERHLAGCPNCRIVVDTLRRTISLFRDLEAPAMPSNLRYQLVKRFEIPSDFNNE